jgi:peptide/nickel transport system permease protein
VTNIGVPPDRPLVAGPSRRSGFAWFVLRRLLGLILITLGMTLVMFTLGQILPADPVSANLSERAASNPATVAAFKARYGLDQPVVIQYLLYLQRLSHGDLGDSLHSLKPVRQDLERAIPATLELGMVSVVIAFPIGLSLGTFAALRRGSMVDRTIRVLSLAGNSVPLFWLALLAVFLFFFVVPVLPASGRLPPGFPAPPPITGLLLVDSAIAGRWDAFVEAARHVILPAAILSLANVSLLARFTRGAVLEVLPADYILAAKAKGLPSRGILLHHTLRAATPSLLAVGGIAVANVLTGAVLVETIFAWPGIGQYAYRSAITSDLPGVMGVSMFIAIVYTTVNIVVDILQTVADPRLSLR